MNAFLKDIFRGITRTSGRFFSLLIITALGAASVVGIQATAIDMRDAADASYKRQALYDLQLKSALGFDDDDVQSVLETSGVETIMPTYMLDFFVAAGGEDRAVRAYAVPDTLNKPDLIAGHMPENSSECVVEQRLLDEGGYQIGDTIKLTLEESDEVLDYLSYDEYTISGVVTSPLYLTFRRGNTSLGNGTLSYYMYLNPNAFTLDVYTDIYIKMTGSGDMYQLSGEYSSAASAWKDIIKPVGDMRTQESRQKLADAQKEIDDGWAEYYDGLSELETKLADARAELIDAKAALDDARLELEDGQAKLDSDIAKARRELNTKASELSDAQNEIDEYLKDLADGRAELEAARAELDAGLAMLEAIAPRGISPELDARYAQVDEGFAELTKRENEIAAAIAAITMAQTELDDGAAQIADARNTLEAERISAQKKIDDGWTEYYSGLEEYTKGASDLTAEEFDARNELADAKKELEKAQEDLDSAPEPEWYYFTRKDGLSFDSYEQDTYRLQRIGYVFPMVFYLVAILVSLTTMSRMIEEHRTQIGIYKALGYRPAAIVQKYLVYAFSASLLGGVAGVVLGSQLFPRIITDAYGHLYYIPPIKTPIPPYIALTAILAAVASVVVVTLITCAGSMRDTAAQLMRPKSPPSGKRVLLERIPFIWNRLSFIGKVTARNIFRYKKRFIMTLTGIAGCSALLVTAFGLRDSISGVAMLQYDALTLYKTRIYTKDIDDARMKTTLDTLIAGESLYIREEAVEAQGESGMMEASVFVPEASEALSGFIVLRNVGDKEPLTLTEDGVIITDKLAEFCGVSPGGEITFTLSDGKPLSVKVAAVTENYVLHYIYMPPGVYSRLFGTEPAYNSILWNDDTSDESSGALLKNNNVRAVVRVSDMLENLSDSTDALSIVTVVLIVLACSLAFVVLFNLTNINITERIRELATIKVLGFYDSELAMYIYRENGAVTFMGILAGLILGKALHRFVLKTVEIDLLRFPIIVAVQSYIYAIVLSAVFAIFVNLVMNIKLKRIDMVESLKNVE